MAPRLPERLPEPVRDFAWFPLGDVPPGQGPFGPRRAGWGDRRVSDRADRAASCPASSGGRPDTTVSGCPGAAEW
ncbi:hypothetical protein GPN2_13889 [Streptomyces murinus]